MAEVKVLQADYDADYDRRKAAGQTGWRQRISGRRFALTRYNSMSFDDKDGIEATYQCPTCKGGGFVTREDG